MKLVQKREAWSGRQTVDDDNDATNIFRHHWRNIFLFLTTIRSQWEIRVLVKTKIRFEVFEKIYTGQQINRATRYLSTLIRFSQKLKNLQLSKLYLQKVRFMVIKMKGNSLGLINISVFIKDFTKKSRFPVVTIVSNDKVKKKLSQKQR